MIDSILSIIKLLLQWFMARGEEKRVEREKIEKEIDGLVKRMYQVREKRKRVRDMKDELKKKLEK